MKLDIEFTYDGFRVEAVVEGEFERVSREFPEYFDFNVLECVVYDSTELNREIDDYEFSCFEEILAQEVYFKLSQK